MEFLYILCGLFFLLSVNCNPVKEVNGSISSDEEVSEEVFQTTTLDTVTNIEINDTTIVTDETTTTSDILDIVPEKDCSSCIETKFLNHYYAKGCKPVPNSNGCDNCPRKFDCNNKNNVTYGNNECIYNGKKYKVGESIPVPSPCQVCQCGYGFDARYHSGERTSPSTTIHCITVECPEQFAIHSHPVEGAQNDFEKNKNCFNVYEKGECCSVRKECPGAEQMLNSSVCVYNDKTYQIGQKIYPIEDRCKVCICEENWDQDDPLSGSGCYDLKCNLEIEQQLREGCIPIYHEKTCCPIEYHCQYERRQKCGELLDSGPCLGSFRRFYFDQRDGQCHEFIYGGCGGNGNNFRDIEDCEDICFKLNDVDAQSEKNENSGQNPSTNSTNSEDYCVFGGITYPIGHQLDIGQKCIDCDCRVPPDFTCIHRSCPPPPSDRCKVTYDMSHCCPVYDCNYEEKIDSSFNPQSCPTPMCAEGCNFETYPDRCPDCVCEPILAVEDPVIPGEEVPHEVFDV